MAYGEIQLRGVQLFKIEFEPVGRRGECPENETLLDCARRMNADILSICGGTGTCKRCKIQVVSGTVSPPTLEEESTFSEEELKDGYRLACTTYPKSNVKVHIPPESLSAPQRTQVEGLSLAVRPEPAVHSFVMELSPPTLEDPVSDDKNLWAALDGEFQIGQGTMDLKVQQNLSSLLRKLDWNVCAALNGGEIIALDKPSTRWLGLAVDIGTTKIAVYLVDLETGETRISSGLMNPQISYGEDVISRIYTAGKSSENVERLHALLVDTLNKTVSSLCAEIGSAPEHIVDAVIVGNTAIHHLFLKLPVNQLGMSPYVPAVRSAMDIKARDIGLHIAPGGYIHLLPNIAGYVGADHVAMLLAIGMDSKPGITLALDIGTNTEICLNNRGVLRSVSSPSGPAFEGAHIKFGMRAAAGAIEHVRLSGDSLEIQTIGDEAPTGICGSGMFDAVAQMLLSGIIDNTGRMQDHPLVRDNNGTREFVLATVQNGSDITISQKDVRELQMAKAAIRLGIEVLLEEAGIPEKDIDRVIIAGAFGTFIDVESAIAIGMLPPLPLERFKQVGNAAGTGARLALVSMQSRRKAEQIASQVGYIEVAGIPDVSLKFAKASSMSWTV